MHRKLSYLVERNGIKVWLVQCAEPLPTDIILEKRCMLVADEGKVLVKDGEMIGGCVWIINADDKVGYDEIDIPPEPEDDEIPVEEISDDIPDGGISTLDPKQIIG